MQPDCKALLFDVKHAALGIQQFVEDRSYEDFLDDLMLRRAVERQFEIIGEALNRLKKIDEAVLMSITEHRRIIGRLTSDVESIRAGVQEVVFESIINGGQMAVAAALMLFYNWRLFLVILATAPALWFINRQFRKRLTRSHRTIQESYSRVTASLAESINGVRVTQGFVRQDVNAGLFFDLVADHTRHNIGLARTSGVFLPLREQ